VLLFIANGRYDRVHGLFSAFSSRNLLLLHFCKVLLLLTTMHLARSADATSSKCSRDSLRIHGRNSTYKERATERSWHMNGSGLNESTQLRDEFCVHWSRASASRLAAAKLGQLLPGQFSTHAFQRDRSQRSSRTALRFSSVHML